MEWASESSTSSIQPRGESVGGVWGNKLWLYGGLRVGGNEVAALGDVRNYDLSTHR